ncbi:uncharacterized protein LOC126907368 isoform X2 [Daktulosphaira vitifoliae]|nr:uncharacterized protein LOC126907368 isoform X2 [Daktulosphaira vitifoliae]XP_050544546.1 uncharacterized protein LOC126907368 isoform X2 [Daktulosphaira vitifoliae]
MTVKDAFTYKIDKNNILDMSIIVVRLLNYKYAEILRNYAELITLSIKLCEKYLTDNLFREFIDCTQRIEHYVKNSLTMFDNLYQVMTFMSYLDMKFLFTKIPHNPFVMVDEIYFAYHYTNTMKISDPSFYIDHDGNIIPENAILVLLNINTFLNKLYLIAESIRKKKCIFAQLPGQVNYHLIFEERCLHYKSVNSNLTAINIVLIILGSFYMNTIKNDYEDLGFREILKPLLYKCDRCDSLFPPQFDCISQKKGIVNLNILLNEGNWTTLNYLYINHNIQALSTNRVLRDPANDNNFHLKKQYITLLFRCRFFDLLKNFTALLTGVIDLCKKVKNKLKIYDDLNSYYICVTDFFLAMKSVQYFLNYLDTAMEKLKQALIWHENGAFYCLSPIKKMVNNLLKLMKEKNLLRDVFSEGVLSLDEVANNYLAGAQDVASSIKLDLRNTRSIHQRHCYHQEKVLFSKRDVLNISMKNVPSENIADPFYDPISHCQQTCVDLYMFCENFISNEYKNLGFDKIN